MIRILLNLILISPNRKARPYDQLIEAYTHFEEEHWLLRRHTNSLYAGEATDNQELHRDGGSNLPQPGELEDDEKEMVRRYFVLYERYNEMGIPLTINE